MNLDLLLPPIDINDDERSCVVCNKDSYTLYTSRASVEVHNGVMVKKVVCSPPEKQLKQFDEEAIIVGVRRG